MLRDCAPSFTQKTETHNILIRYNEKSVRVPKGAHKKRKNEIQKGHVKNLAKMFQIVDCAHKHFPELRLKK